MFVKYDHAPCCFHTLRVSVVSSKVRNTKLKLQKSFIQVFIDHIMSVKRLKTGYNSLHIALHWFHVMSVETLRFTMYILIQSVRITIFFELMFKIHISLN